MTYDYMPKPTRYALYLHGMGSGAKSGTRSSLAHYLPDYEWLSPELPLDPIRAFAVVEDYCQVFEPELVVGTSLGGLYVLFATAPQAVKVAVNPTYNIDTVLRKAGYGRHNYHCEREDGATHYVIDEPLVKQYVQFRDSQCPSVGRVGMAIFSNEDEMVGREGSKQNAQRFEQLGYEIEWSNHFGHRMNQAAGKLVAAYVKRVME